MNLYKICLDEACWAEVLKDPSHVLKHLEAQQPELYARLTAEPAEEPSAEV